VRNSSEKQGVKEVKVDLNDSNDKVSLLNDHDPAPNDGPDITYKAYKGVTKTTT